MFETWYVKGVPFVNKRCMKGVPFLSKMVYKRVRGWTARRSLPLRFFNEYSSPRVSSVFIHSGIRAYLRTKNNSNHNSRVYSGYTNDRAIVACKTGALWAKRGEGGILREAGDEGRGGEKKRACCQSIVLALPTFTVWTLRSDWLIDDALFWHVCLEQNIRHAFMFFWRCCSRSLSFISECSRNKRKPQEMFNLPNWAINYRNWFYPRSYFLCCYRCFW